MHIKTTLSVSVLFFFVPLSVNASTMTDNIFASKTTKITSQLTSYVSEALLDTIEEIEVATSKALAESINIQSKIALEETQNEIGKHKEAEK